MTQTIGYDRPSPAIGELSLPPGVTARQLLAQVSREIQEEKDAAKAAFEAREEAARLERKQLIEDATARFTALVAEYDTKAKELRQLVMQMWDAHESVCNVGGKHSLPMDFGNVNLPTLGVEERYRNRNFSTTQHDIEQSRADRRKAMRR
jgi:hypothetical protein